jgi:hypothetical protein
LEARADGGGTIRRLGLSIGATVVAFVPGFALPFVATTQLSPVAASSVLLAYSVAVSVNGTVGNAIEMNSIATVGSQFAEGRRPSFIALARLVFRSIRFTLVASSLLIPISTVLLVGQFEHRHSLILAGISLLPLPALYAASNTLSGAVIAANRTPIAVLTQSLRALPPLLLLVFSGADDVVAISLAFVFGEGVRILFLFLVLSNTDEFRQGELAEQPLATSGIAWQSSANFVAQFGPLINRTFLAAAGPVAVLAYEMADRINSAGNQLLTSGVLLPKIADWSRLNQNIPETHRIINRDLKKLTLLAVTLALIGAATLVLAASAPIFPDQWRKGFWWGALLLLALPTAFLITACNRLLVLRGRQRILLPLMILGLALTLSLNFLFVLSLGSIGVVIALVSARYILAGVYLYVLRREQAKDVERSTGAASGGDGRMRNSSGGRHRQVRGA